MGWDPAARFRTPLTRIDVTPFIGVAMTLLIAVMVLSPAITISSKLPRAHHDALMQEPRLVVGIDSEGRMFIGDVPNPGPIPPRMLAERLRREVLARPTGERGELYLVADLHVEYRTVLDVLGAACDVGIRRVGLVTEERRP